ncbi:hypothetical protein BH10ACI3_BH10ACI3_01690 [soil metagenome]
MKYQFPLVLAFILFAFSSQYYGQVPPAPAPTPWPVSPTTSDKAQIAIPDGNGLINKVNVTSSDPERGKNSDDYVERSASDHIYFINVTLPKIGANKFVVLTFKDEDMVGAYPITIIRTNPDPKAKNGSSADFRTWPPKATQTALVNSPESLPSANFVASTSVPVVNSFGGYDNTGSQSFSIPVKSSQNSDVSVPTVSSTSSVRVPLPAPSPSAEQKKKDSENERFPINPGYRLIFGFQTTGGSSSTSQGNPFVDLFLSVPVGQLGVNYNSKGIVTRRYFKNSFWTDLKLTSTPNQTLPDFAALTSSGVTGLFSTNQASKINDIVQAFQMRIGWETAIRPNLSIIGGVGATSPLSAEKTVVAYKVPRLANGTVQPDFKQLFGPNLDFTGIDNLVLTSGDRDRFIRNWFVGGRLRQQFFGNIEEVYPAQFELTFGQDEQLTNKLIGAVMKFDSFVPVPIKGLSFLYFGGSFTTKLTRKVNTTTFPFFLEPASNINIFGNTNFVRNFRDFKELNSDRDIFSFRFGIDLLQLLNKRDKQPNDASNGRTKGFY